MTIALSESIEGPEGQTDSEEESVSDSEDVSAAETSDDTEASTVTRAMATAAINAMILRKFFFLFCFLFCFLLLVPIVSKAFPDTVSQKRKENSFLVFAIIYSMTQETESVKGFRRRSERIHIFSPENSNKNGQGLRNPLLENPFKTFSIHAKSSPSMKKARIKSFYNKIIPSAIAIKFLLRFYKKITSEQQL